MLPELPIHPAAPEPRGIALRAVAVAGVGVGAIVLTGLAAARLVGGLDPVEVLARVRPAWLLAAVALAVAGQLLHGLRVALLLPPSAGPRPGAVLLGLLFLAGTVLNLSFPGPAGELAAAMVVRRRSGTPSTAVLAASLHGRFAGLLTGSLALLLALPWLPASPALGPWLWAGGAVVGLGGLVLAGLSLRPVLLAGLSQATIGRVAALPGPVGRFAAGLDAQVALFAGYLGAVAAQPRAWLGAMAVSALMLACFVGTTWLAGAAVGGPPAPAGAFLAVTSSQLTSIVAVAVPGGLGLFDLAFAGSLVLSGGLGPAEAAAVTVAIRLVQVLVLVPGVLCFLAFAGELLLARQEAVGSGA